MGGSETGIDGITVSLYWDRNGDGNIDSDDPLIDTEITVNGLYTLYTGTNWRLCGGGGCL